MWEALAPCAAVEQAACMAATPTPDPPRRPQVERQPVARCQTAPSPLRLVIPSLVPQALRLKGISYHFSTEIQYFMIANIFFCIPITFILTLDCQFYA